LCIALNEGHYDVVKYLLSSGADINLSDDSGQSPLFVASENGHNDVVQYLLSKTSYSAYIDATHNGHCPHSSNKLISAPKLSKY
jgi:ankyrin repeat protein